MTDGMFITSIWTMLQPTPDSKTGSGQSAWSSLPWYSGAHRGSGFKSLISTAIFDEARMRIARFFNADPDYHIAIFCKNTTEAINPSGRPPSDSSGRHGSNHHNGAPFNDLPWRRVARVIRADVRSDGPLDEADFEKSSLPPQD